MQQREFVQKVFSQPALEDDGVIMLLEVMVEVVMVMVVVVVVLRTRKRRRKINLQEGAWQQRRFVQEVFSQPALEDDQEIVVMVVGNSCENTMKWLLG